jgi:hypothetical protein
MEAHQSLRPTTLANLRRGTHDLELSLRVLPNFTPYLAPELRYWLRASVSGVHARLRSSEKHWVRRYDNDIEGRSYAQMLRTAATAFLDYVSPFADEEWIDGSPWPYDVGDFKRDPFLPRFFRWEEAEFGSYFRGFEPVFETTRPLVEAAPILLRELESYFTVEYAVATKRSRLLFPDSDYPSGHQAVLVGHANDRLLRSSRDP